MIIKKIHIKKYTHMTLNIAICKEISRVNLLMSVITKPVRLAELGRLELKLISQLYNLNTMEK